MTQPAISMPPVAKPAHIPDNLVVDYDIFHPPHEDPIAAWKALQATSPSVVWTPHNGGHWIALRGEAIKTAQTDHERFSHRLYKLPKDETPGQSPLPLGIDPPNHFKYRRPIMAAFLPKHVNALESTVRQIARDLAHELKDRKSCDFINDFARKLPIVVFLGIVNLPLEDREFLLTLAELAVRSSNPADRQEAYAKIAAYLRKWVDERRVNPGDDLISSIIHADIDGRPIEEREAFSMLTLVMFGGLDTVASMMGFIMRFLATHPEHRQQLIDTPGIRDNAVEELLRVHGITNTARYITGDFDYFDAPLREGDMICVPNVLYGSDDTLVDDPMKVDFARKKISLATFGNGPHTCPGAVLARRELRVMIDEWLAVIPHFTLDENKPPQYLAGLVNGLDSLHMKW